MTIINDFDESYTEDSSESCFKCHDSKTYYQRKGPHIGLYCYKCGWLKWKEQKPDAFIIGFGKYKGKSLGEIKTIDIEYLKWLIKNIDNKKIINKIEKLL